MLAIYTRLSREDEESNSIENQIREGKAYATKSRTAYEIYNEGEGISGRSDIGDRPELDRLMRDISIGKITSVWFRNQNRLERNSNTFHVFSSLAKKKGLTVVFGDKVMEWDDPTNFLQSSILTAINSYQAELQSHQTKKALLDNARDGKAFGNTPYGYSTDSNGYLQINEKEAEVVKRIYSLSLDGKGTRSIAEILNEGNVATRYNGLEGSIRLKHKDTGKVTIKDKKSIGWAGNTIRGVIVNKLYKGIRIWNGHNTHWAKKQLNKGKTLAPEKVIELPHLKIVAPRYWQKVNDNLQNNLNNRGKSVEHKYMLKGLLECSQCGRNYYGRTRQNKKDNYYMCSSKRFKNEKCGNRSINIDVLEGFIWNTMFEGDLLYDKMVNTFKDGKTEKRRGELEKVIASHERHLEGLAKERRRMVQMVVKGVLKEDEVGGERLRITRAENDVTQKLDRDSEELYNLQDQKRILEDVANDWSWLENNPLLEADAELKASVQQLFKKTRRKEEFKPPFNEKRRILKKYLKRVFINFDYEYRVFTITVKYNIPLEDEVYVMDSNYIAAFNVNGVQMVDWHNENSRHFTIDKEMETDNLLKYYCGLLA